MNAKEFDTAVGNPLPCAVEHAGTAAIAMIAEFAGVAHARGVPDAMLAAHFANIAMLHARRAGMDESAVDRMFEIARRMVPNVPATNAPGGKS